MAITLDAGALDPYDEPASLKRQVSQVRAALDRHGLARVIETGARYLLNPRMKHDPTLMDPDPDAKGHSNRLSASRNRPGRSRWGRGGLALVGLSSRRGRRKTAAWTASPPGFETAARSRRAARIPLAFEPEPGMFIDTLDTVRPAR